MNYYDVFLNINNLEPSEFLNEYYFLVARNPQLYYKQYYSHILSFFLVWFGQLGNCHPMMLQTQTINTLITFPHIPTKTVPNRQGP